MYNKLILIDGDAIKETSEGVREICIEDYGVVVVYAAKKVVYPWHKISSVVMSTDED